MTGDRDRGRRDTGRGRGQISPILQGGLSADLEETALEPAEKTALEAAEETALEAACLASSALFARAPSIAAGNSLCWQESWQEVARLLAPCASHSCVALGSCMHLARWLAASLSLAARDQGRFGNVLRLFEAVALNSRKSRVVDVVARQVRMHARAHTHVRASRLLLMCARAQARLAACSNLILAACSNLILADPCCLL